MPIFVYVLLGIALLVTLILFTKIRLFICYDDILKAYAKIWFLKFNIFPTKERPSKKEKEKSAPQAQTTAVTEQKTEKSVVKKLWEMKTVLSNIISRLLEKVHFRFLKLKINVACNNAAKTALLYAGATQGVSYLIEILQNISNVDVVNKSQVYINSDFVSQNSDFEGKIELYIRVLPLISVGIHSFKEYLKYKSAKED